jgi:hypothetical protein
LPESTEVRLELQDYLARTGMTPTDFARRINYARETVYQFLNGHYSRISSNDGLIRTAIRDFIAAHPIATPVISSGKLYETENVRLLRRYFYEALDHGRAYYLYGAPGTQKTYVLQHLIAELNRSEIAKNGEGRRAYYVYVRQGIGSLDLMKRVAQSCGAIGMGSRLAGYEDVNDAERLAQDPTFRLMGSERIWERGAALTSRLQSFETELLTQEGNLSGLAVINRELIARAEAIDSPQRVVLDMDSTEIPVYGQQEQSAYNGHFESTCYHPLLLFNGEGDCLAGKLRPGNVHSAEDWAELLLPEIERQQELGKEVVFRADAAFAKPEIYEALEERGVKYAIRIPTNDSLERDIGELLTRPVGRPSYKPVVWYKGFLYQAASWKTARQVVAKVKFHFGELFPRVGFIVTNLETPSRAVVRFYNKRGTAEQ